MDARPRRLGSLLALAVLALAGARRPAEADETRPRDRLAVLDFSVSEKLKIQERDLGESLASVVTACLNKKYDVVARAELVKVLEEQKLQMSDLFDSAEKGAKVGKFLKVQKVLAGLASSVGRKVALDLKIMDVETGRYGEMAVETGEEVDEFLSMIPRLLVKLGLADAATQPPVSGMSATDLRRLLEDLARWDAATSEQRRAAAQHVAGGTEGFSVTGLKTFSCGGQTHEVALFRHEKTGMEFALIPAGTFTMGSPATEPERESDETEHTVTLTQPFLLARTEVPQSVYEKAMGTNPSSFKGADRPVECVSWDDAQTFCARTGLVLPTEAQWEWACRAGTRTAWSTGSERRTLQGFANIYDAYAKAHVSEIPYDTTALPYEPTEDVSDGFATTSPVKTFAANAFGL